jgi:hypothetical protein
MSGTDSRHELSTDLAPDASIGEVRAEIDSARHDATRTVAVLVDRFAVGEQARRRVRVAANRAIPAQVSEPARKVLALLGGLPLWVRIGVPAIVVLRVVFRHRKR